MAKDAILQVRIDADLKKQAEDLYKSMGISLSEAVRMFVAQSIVENQMPFRPRSTMKRSSCKAYGALRLYMNPGLRGQERDAWVRSLSAKEAKRYGNDNR
ncbi:MAG: type II toxin-antitoxin system RelB/DinJ family antitoxin [Coriobacteriia bacterium]|nr:type II toxin-antitoxin system RelB/DinJ family antitoxin [Coriobacteriia bacterium]MBS5477469.1 type II toxin-antitoxin system RelB/DinJ family antitoxin [Coriobacteriia bacterium]